MKYCNMYSLELKILLASAETSDVLLKAESCVEFSKNCQVVCFDDTCSLQIRHLHSHFVLISKICLTLCELLSIVKWWQSETQVSDHACELHYLIKHFSMQEFRSQLMIIFILFLTFSFHFLFFSFSLDWVTHLRLCLLYLSQK